LGDLWAAVRWGAAQSAAPRVAPGARLANPGIRSWSRNRVQSVPNAWYTVRQATWYTTRAKDASQEGVNEEERRARWRPRMPSSAKLPTMSA